MGNHVVAGLDQCGGTKHKRERGFTPEMSLTKHSSLCKCLASTEFGSTVAVCLPARFVTKSSTPTAASIDTISFFVASLTIGRVFATSTCGGGGKEEDGSGQLQEDADILYPLNWKSIVLVFNKYVCEMFFFGCKS